MMVPAMGAPTLPSTARSAFSRTAFLPMTCSAFLSPTSTTRGTPLASKNTSRLPAGGGRAGRVRGQASVSKSNSGGGGGGQAHK